MNYTYILTCADGTLYCGWTNDLDKRLKAHNAGRGAKYTKSRRPVALSYYEAFETKGRSHETGICNQAYDQETERDVDSREPGLCRLACGLMRENEDKERVKARKG